MKNPIYEPKGAARHEADAATQAKFNPDSGKAAP